MAGGGCVRTPVCVRQSETIKSSYPWYKIGSIFLGQATLNFSGTVFAAVKGFG